MCKIGQYVNTYYCCGRQTSNEWINTCSGLVEFERPGRTPEKWCRYTTERYLKETFYHYCDRCMEEDNVPQDQDSVLRLTAHPRFKIPQRGLIPRSRPSQAPPPHTSQELPPRYSALGRAPSPSHWIQDTAGHPPRQVRFHPEQPQQLPQPLPQVAPRTSPPSRRNPSPPTRSNVSPPARRDASPITRRVTSPRTRRNPSPLNRRNTSPRTRRSPSPGRPQQLDIVQLLGEQDRPRSVHGVRARWRRFRHGPEF